MGVISKYSSAAIVGIVSGIIGSGIAVAIRMKNDTSSNPMKNGSKPIIMIVSPLTGLLGGIVGAAISDSTYHVIAGGAGLSAIIVFAANI
jgi:hypothetical protein